MNNILRRIAMWFIWKDFHYNMKKVIGYNSLDCLKNDLFLLEQKIKYNNEIPIDQNITYYNTKKSERYDVALYITMQHFFKIGKCYSYARDKLNN